MRQWSRHTLAGGTTYVAVAVIAVTFLMPRPVMASPFFRGAPFQSSLAPFYVDINSPYRSAFALVDLNADGKADLLASNGVSHNLEVSFGAGDGTFVFSSASNIYFVERIGVGDIDNDGHPDAFVVANGRWAHFLSADNGLWQTFRITWGYRPNNPASMIVADFDSDGYPDLAVSDRYLDRFYFQHLGSNGISRDSVSGSFGNGNGCNIVACDIDQDGFVDIVGGMQRGCMLKRGTPAVYNYWGAEEYVGPGGLDIVSSDFNGDGRMDIVCGRHLYLNQAGTLTHAGELAADIKVSGDINADGYPDLVGVTGDSILVYAGQPDGSFLSTGDLIRLSNPEDIRLADVNGDGWLDLGVSHLGEGLLSIYLTSQSTAVLATTLEADADPNEVRLVWQVATSCGSSITVERREAEGPWFAVAELQPDADGHLRFVDRNVRAGQSYAYRLAWTCMLQTVEVAEVQVTVPTGLLVLEAPRPNPARASATVSFVLPRDGNVSLEIFDLSGRRVGMDQLGVISSGRHEIPLSAARMLQPGVYHLLLHQSGETRLAKFVVTR